MKGNRQELEFSAALSAVLTVKNCKHTETTGTKRKGHEGKITGKWEGQKEVEGNEKNMKWTQSKMEMNRNKRKRRERKWTRKERKDMKGTELQDMKGKKHDKAGI